MESTSPGGLGKTRTPAWVGVLALQLDLAWNPACRPVGKGVKLGASMAYISRRLGLRILCAENLCWPRTHSQTTNQAFTCGDIGM